MNKTSIVFRNAIIICCLLVIALFAKQTCVSYESSMNQKRIEQSIKNSVNSYTTTIDSLITDEYTLNEITQYTDTMYIVKIKIHQTTYTIDPFEYIKNKMNDIEFEIPVDKEYYNKCKVGHKINDPKLKMGSLVMDGDFSKLKVTISDKYIKKR